jgi:hypothetical protein
VSVLDTIRAASAHRAVSPPICMNAALVAEHQKLQASYMAAQRKVLETTPGTPARDAAQAASKEAAKAMDKVRERMAASEVTFTFERLPWTRRLGLQDEHPSKDSDLGFNRATFAPALIKECCVEVADSDSTATGADITADVWEVLFDKGNYAAVDQLFGVALSVNDLGATVPTSALALLNSQDIGGSSKQPGPGVSARNGSKGGSPRRKRSTPTTRKAGSPA